MTLKVGIGDNTFVVPPISWVGLNTRSKVIFEG